MARIIVAGDSWSCSQITINPQEWQGAYAAELSLANRLRSRGHSVYEVAGCGSGIKDQMHALNGLFADQRWQMENHVDYVLLGWTEWTRATALQNSASAPPLSMPNLGRTYTKLFSREQARTQESFRLFTQTWPKVKFLHWGALAPVWCDLEWGSTHSVLYTEYAAQIYGIEPNHSQLLSYSPRSASTRTISKWLRRVMPGTDRGLADHFAQNIEARFRSAVRSERFTDGGHLDFAHYDLLIERVEQTIRGEIAVQDLCAQPFSWNRR